MLPEFVVAGDVERSAGLFISLNGYSAAYRTEHDMFRPMNWFTHRHVYCGFNRIKLCMLTYCVSLEYDTGADDSIVRLSGTL